MKQLIVLRHAKSDWDADYAGDHERPLSKRGRKAARRIGRWLASNVDEPERVLCSTSVRTSTTWEIVAAAAGWNDATVDFEHDLYLSGSATIVASLRALPENVDCAMFVGHMPGVEETVEFLTGRALMPGPRGKAFPTAAVAVLDVRCDWGDLEADCADLIAFTRPRELD